MSVKIVLLTVLFILKAIAGEPGTPMRIITVPLNGRDCDQTAFSIMSENKKAHPEWEITDFAWGCGDMQTEGVPFGGEVTPDDAPAALPPGHPHIPGDRETMDGGKPEGIHA